MNESEGVAVELFNKAAIFWKSGKHAELTPLAIKHLELTIAYAKEHPEEVRKRAKQLDQAISHFNKQKTSGIFKPDEVNSRKLATEILGPHETLPFLSEMPLEKKSTDPYFASFTNLMRLHYYTFVDKPEIDDPKLLITGLLVDGYGFALRAKRAIEHRHTIGKDDLIIVNSICEMVEPGTLQTEMYLANWYKPDNGLSQAFCDRIHTQFGDVKPLIRTGNVQTSYA